MKVLVTGATGFVGTALTRHLVAAGFQVRAAVRRSVELPVECAVVGELNARTDWAAALAGVDAIVHLAARVHVMRDTPSGAAEFRWTNVDGTVNLAEQAAKCGVRRFVFLSSVKVNGEATDAVPYSADSTPAPVDPYGASKLEAEIGLRSVAGLEPVVVRPPLIHGPGVKGNLLRLCRLAWSGIPVPFGAIENRRDLVGVDNVVDLITTCLHHSAAGGRTFLVSDGAALSTPDLYRAIARAMDKPARMVPVPLGVLRLVGVVAGARAEVERLTGSLEVDITATKTALGWRPPVPVQEGIRRMVLAFLRRRVSR